MRRWLGAFCLVFGGVLVGFYSAQAQEHVDGLTIRDFVEVLAEYDVRHIDVPYVTSWYGMTVPDERAIYLVKQMDLAQRRKTAIHEVCHVALYNRGVESDEETCKIMAAVEYQKYFGNGSE